VRRWLLVAALAWLLVALVDGAVDRAEAAEARWGRTRRVWVADRPVAGGDRLAGAVRSRSWPAALVPDAALARVPDEARAASAIDPGAPLTAASIEVRTTERRTVAVPVPEARLPVEAGDRVEVWATSDPAAVADGDRATRRVATGARVASASDRTVVLEVRPSQVEALADAAASATLTLVGVP
jgi:Flp pilus assembly protein CpaB